MAAQAQDQHYRLVRMSIANEFLSFARAHEGDNRAELILPVQQQCALWKHTFDILDPTISASLMHLASTIVQHRSRTKRLEHT